MDPLVLSWIVEYACATKRDDIVDLLYSDFVQIVREQGSNKEYKNAKGKMIVRSIMGVIESEENPNLQKEYHLLASLLRNYGSPVSEAETAKIVIYMQQQCYVHFLINISNLTNPSTKEVDEQMNQLKKFHQTMVVHSEARFENVEALKEQGKPTGLEGMLAQPEKKLVKQFSKFIKKYGPSTSHGALLLKQFIKEYNFEKFKGKILEFLQSIDDTLPPTTLEYFLTLWKNRRAVLKNGISLEQLSSVCDTNSLNQIHTGENRSVQKFIRENRVENLFNGRQAPVTPPPEPVEKLTTIRSVPTQADVEKLVRAHARRHTTHAAPASNVREIENFERLPSPISSLSATKERGIPMNTSNPPTTEKIHSAADNDPLHDLLELSQDNNNSPSPLSQPISQPPQTPVVAAELRASIQHLQRMRGSDPLYRAETESQQAKKRPLPKDFSQPSVVSKRPKTATRAEREVLNWDSDDEESIHCPEFRAPRNVPELHDISPNETEAPAPQHGENQQQQQQQPAGGGPPRAVAPVANPRKGKGRWTDEEVDNLIEGLRLFGVGNWKSILNHFDFGGRTGVNLKDKYRNLMKHYTIDELFNLRR